MIADETCVSGLGGQPTDGCIAGWCCGKTCFRSDGVFRGRPDEEPCVPCAKKHAKPSTARKGNVVCELCLLRLPPCPVCQRAFGDGAPIDCLGPNVRHTHSKCRREMDAAKSRKKKK